MTTARDLRAAKRARLTTELAPNVGDYVRGEPRTDAENGMIEAEKLNGWRCLRHPSHDPSVRSTRMPQSTLSPRLCARCGAPLKSRDTSRKYCSRECAWASQNTSLADKFWSKVQKGDGCWVWAGALSSHGYGLISVQSDGKSKKLTAHRCSYELNVGPIPDGMVVCHRCDNPKCVNPEHLFIGTQLDNISDMHAKGRADWSGLHHSPGDPNHPARLHPEIIVRGERHHKAVLTEAQVIEIRQRYANGGTSFNALAHEFGVSKRAIHFIIHRRNWKHVP